MNQLIGTEAQTLMSLSKCKLKNRFFVRIRGCSNTCNGNGYKNWLLEWGYFQKRERKLLYTQILGNGDNGERCM